jgi:uncharacterized BrkB/YihY/UPF0761 family membrane protein
MGRAAIHSLFTLRTLLVSTSDSRGENHSEACSCIAHRSDRTGCNTSGILLCVFYSLVALVVTLLLLLHTCLMPSFGRCIPTVCELGVEMSDQVDMGTVIWTCLEFAVPVMT